MTDTGWFVNPEMARAYEEAVARLKQETPTDRERRAERILRWLPPR